MIKMHGFIIVCSTNIHNFTDFTTLSNALALFSSVINWSVDLSDSDKVLRIEASLDISSTLIIELKSLGIRCTIMGIFTNKLCNS